MREREGEVWSETQQVVAGARLVLCECFETVRGQSIAGSFTTVLRDQFFQNRFLSEVVTLTARGDETNYQRSFEL
jgi:hypothetical protein